MATTREQLISDWRQRLAAAEESAAASPRAAWLARMQVRLYRFLLACYGRSKWEPPGEPRESTRLVFDSAAAESLEGKPARSRGQIRSVLTAVAKAQDDDHAPGPLTGGLDHDSWVVVAAASSKLKVNRCVEVLARSGLHRAFASGATIKRSKFRLTSGRRRSTLSSSSVSDSTSRPKRPARNPFPRGAGSPRCPCWRCGRRAC